MENVPKFAGLQVHYQFSICIAHQTDEADFPPDLTFMFLINNRVISGGMINRSHDHCLNSIYSIIIIITHTIQVLNRSSQTSQGGCRWNSVNLQSLHDLHICGLFGD